jgi:hypothetical protein
MLIWDMSVCGERVECAHVQLTDTAQEVHHDHVGRARKGRKEGKKLRNRDKKSHTFIHQHGG